MKYFMGKAHKRHPGKKKEGLGGRL